MRSELGVVIRYCADYLYRHFLLRRLSIPRFPIAQTIYTEFPIAQHNIDNKCKKLNLNSAIGNLGIDSLRNRRWRNRCGPAFFAACRALLPLVSYLNLVYVIKSPKYRHFAAQSILTSYSAIISIIWRNGVFCK